MACNQSHGAVWLALNWPFSHILSPILFVIKLFGLQCFDIATWML